MVLTWRKRCVDGLFKYLAIEGDEFSDLSVVRVDLLTMGSINLYIR